MSAGCTREELEQKLEEWGYAFGTDDKGFERRLLAFRQRYRIDMPDTGYKLSPRDIGAVESLLKQRKEAQNVQAVQLTTVQRS